MYYKSTRDKNVKISASEAILKGISDDGGLFVPEFLPALDVPFEEIAKMDYRDTAFLVMGKLLTDFSEDELRNCIDSAYDQKFDVPEIAPLRYTDDKTAYLELFHGKTIAFKDMALSILPHLMKCASLKQGKKEEIVILTATSGDTGKAALAGFADVPGIKIIVFYPKDGVSPVQKLQMVTEKGKNTFVVGVDGNFDDCQTGVKKMFADEDLKERLRKKGYVFSSANSINIGRLVPQIVYYVYAYSRLIRDSRINPGDEINIVVPTGNFGNILAAFYAKNMGLPVHKLICASNENKVLFDFFNTGKYDRNREFILTSSPSMDILISSNLERLIYHLTNDDPDDTSAFMSSLSGEGRYEITGEMADKLGDFSAYFASEKDTAEKIRSLYEATGYVIDTHTAVAGSVLDKYRADNDDDAFTVIASTASPFKFSGSVISAIKGERVSGDELDLFQELSDIAGVRVPEAVRDLKTAEIIHKTECGVDEMEKTVEEFLLSQ